MADLTPITAWLRSQQAQRAAEKFSHAPMKQVPEDPWRKRQREIAAELFAPKSQYIPAEQGQEMIMQQGLPYAGAAILGGLTGGPVGAAAGIGMVGGLQTLEKVSPRASKEVMDMLNATDGIPPTPMMAMPFMLGKKATQPSLYYKLRDVFSKLPERFNQKQFMQAIENSDITPRQLSEELRWTGLGDWMKEEFGALSQGPKALVQARVQELRTQGLPQKQINQIISDEQRAGKFASDMQGGILREAALARLDDAGLGIKETVLESGEANLNRVDSIFNNNPNRLGEFDDILDEAAGSRPSEIIKEPQYEGFELHPKNISYIADSGVGELGPWQQWSDKPTTNYREWVYNIRDENPITNELNTLANKKRQLEAVFQRAHNSMNDYPSDTLRKELAEITAKLKTAEAEAIKQFPNSTASIYKPKSHTHFSGTEPGQLGWARTVDTDLPGHGKIRVIAEMQSDYNKDIIKSKPKPRLDISKYFTERGLDPPYSVTAQSDIVAGKIPPPPDAPLVEDHVKFLMKRQVSAALAEGLDGVSWLTGEEVGKINHRSLSPHPHQDYLVSAAIGPSGYFTIDIISPKTAEVVKELGPQNLDELGINNARFILNQLPKEARLTETPGRDYFHTQTIPMKDLPEPLPQPGSGYLNIYNKTAVKAMQDLGLNPTKLQTSPEMWYVDLRGMGSERKRQLLKKATSVFSGAGIGTGLELYRQQRKQNEKKEMQ